MEGSSFDVGTLFVFCYLLFLNNVTFGRLINQRAKYRVNLPGLRTVRHADGRGMHDLHQLRPLELRKNGADWRYV